MFFPVMLRPAIAKGTCGIFPSWKVCEFLFNVIIIRFAAHFIQNYRPSDSGIIIPNPPTLIFCDCSTNTIKGNQSL